VEAADNFDLEDETKEVGREDRDLETIINFFEKAMETDDVQLTRK